MTIRDVALMLLELRADIVDGRITPAWPVGPLRDRIDATEALRRVRDRHYVTPGRIGAEARWRRIAGGVTAGGTAKSRKVLTLKKKE